MKDMFCWMDTNEIMNQFDKNEVKSDELKDLLERERGFGKLLSGSFLMGELTKNKEFMENFEKWTIKKENCEKIFDFIKGKTPPIQVFVYPKKEHLELLDKIGKVVDLDDHTKLKPWVGEVWIVKNNESKIESWENLNWERKKGQLIEIAGIVGKNCCFYPFERPTNCTISLKCRLNPKFMNYRIGGASHFDKLYDVYSLIIGKFIPPYTIKPIFFYDFTTSEGEEEMNSYIKLWYDIFKDKIFKKLYGHEVDKGDTMLEDAYSKLCGNDYYAGEWLDEEQESDLNDYCWQADHASRVSDIDHLKIAKTGSFYRHRHWKIWRCSHYAFEY